MDSRDILLACMNDLKRDLPRLQTIDNYWVGNHMPPYMPLQADAEYKHLAKRCVTNLMPSAVSIPAQALYVDGIRSGVKSESDAPEAESSAHWEHWQRSHMDAGQVAIHRGALAYGQSFTVTERDAKGRTTTRGLSPLRTSAYFEFPASDTDPLGAFTVIKWPIADPASESHVPGRGYFWDATTRYEIAFGVLGDSESIKVLSEEEHGCSTCPITRFAVQVDLEGRCIGIIEPLMRLQDRINQTVFDLLIAQTGGSWNVRTATGMAPPLVMEAKEVDDPETGETKIIQIPKLDGNGNYIPRPVTLKASDFLYAEDPDTKFGTLPGTPLGGYIEALEQVLRHFTTISQTPPHYMLGQIANLSADAMQAAETTLMRKVAEIQVALGESWERDFRLAAELNGDEQGADDYSAEVLWRDTDAQSLSRVADALGKLREMLAIPAEALWPRVPGVTQQELQEWNRLKALEPEQALAGGLSNAEAMFRSSGDSRPDVGGDPASPVRQRRAWSA